MNKTYTELLNKLIFKPLDERLVTIEKELGYSKSHISQTYRKIKGLRREPRIVGNKVVCYLCSSNEDLVIHHDHNTGEYIAIICQACNIKVQNKPLDFYEILGKRITIRLKNNQYKKWDRKTHPKMVRFILEHNISFGELLFLREADVKELFS